MSVDDKDDKRTHKCPGCKIPHTNHSFGVPGPHCQGTKGLPSTEPSSVPPFAELPGAQHAEKAVDNAADKTASAVQEIDVEDEEAALQQKLKQLYLAEDAPTEKEAGGDAKTSHRRSRKAASEPNCKPSQLFSHKSSESATIFTIDRSRGS